ncbi:MAG: hypothetical protein WC897_05380 [Candidatus Gracilibacteria bacterium]
MPQDKKSKKDKINELAGLAVNSQTLKNFLELSHVGWVQFLELWDEEGIDDFLLVLKEEKSMLADVSNKALRKHKINETRLKQRLEKIVVEANNLTNK